MKTFKEFMSEKKLIDRTTIFIFCLFSAFAGALLMLMIALLGVLS